MKRVARPQAINFENGIKDKPTFSAAEMANRNGKLQLFFHQFIILIISLTLFIAHLAGLMH